MDLYIQTIYFDYDLKKVNAIQHFLKKYLTNFGNVKEITQTSRVSERGAAVTAVSERASGGRQPLNDS